MTTQPTEYAPCVTVVMGHVWPSTRIEVTTGPTPAVTVRSGESYLVLHAQRPEWLRRLARTILDALPESDGTL